MTQGRAAQGRGKVMVMGKHTMYIKGFLLHMEIR